MLNRDKEFTKSNREPTERRKKKIIAINSLIILSILLILQGCNTEQNKMDIAVKKVTNLFEAEDEEKVKEGKSGKIKDSTDQEQIDEALKAIDKIDTSGGKQSKNYGVVFSLQSAVLVAQVQLEEREGTTRDSFENYTQDEQKEQFQPDEDDVVWKHNKLENKDILEEFMNVAGENGKNNDIEIRVVKDEEEKGVIIYDLKSVYDKNADEGWIEVIPDLSHYSPSETETQSVFNMSQQCSYISKDIETGYYKLNECYTHWEYPLLPIINES